MLTIQNDLCLETWVARSVVSSIRWVLARNILIIGIRGINREKRRNRVNIPWLVNAEVEEGVTVAESKVVGAGALVTLHLDLDLPTSLAWLERKARSKLTDEQVAPLAQTQSRIDQKAETNN